MFNIETGYKPEFGLGAVYAGENAANNEVGAQLELIKQFLANQHSQVQNPLDERRMQQQINMDQYKEVPEYGELMTRIQRGQADLQETAGDKAKALLPFIINSEMNKNKAEAGQASMLDRFYNASNRQYDQGLPVDQRIASAEERNALQNTIGETPELYGKRSLQDDELAIRYKIAQLNADSMASRAQASAKQPAELDLKKRLQQVESMLAGLIPIPEGITPAVLQELAQTLRHDIMISNPNAFQPGKFDPDTYKRSPSAVDQNSKDVRGIPDKKPQLPSGWTIKN